MGARGISKGTYPMDASTWVDPAGRVCTECKEYKLWECFSLSSGKSIPFMNACKKCFAGRWTETQRKNGREPRHQPREYTTENGYVMMLVEDRHESSGNRKYRPKHQVIMEIMIGRELHPWENVHHKNGIRDDNHYDNLELWCVPQPYGQRVEDLVDWVINNYPDRMKEVLDA